MEETFLDQFFFYKGWDEGNGPLSIQVYDVTWKKDFGPFKRNDLDDTILVDFEKGVIQSYNNNGDIVKSCKIDIVVKEN